MLLREVMCSLVSWVAKSAIRPGGALPCYGLGLELIAGLARTLRGPHILKVYLHPMSTTFTSLALNNRRLPYLRSTHLYLCQLATTRGLYNKSGTPDNSANRE